MPPNYKSLSPTKAGLTNDLPYVLQNPTMCDAVVSGVDAWYHGENIKW